MFSNIYLDAALPWQLGFQDPATAIMEGIINFHHDLFFFLVVIFFFVMQLYIRCLYIFSSEPFAFKLEKIKKSFAESSWVKKLQNNTKVLMMFGLRMYVRDYDETKQKELAKKMLKS